MIDVYNIHSQLTPKDGTISTVVYFSDALPRKSPILRTMYHLELTPESYNKIHSYCALISTVKPNNSNDSIQSQISCLKLWILLLHYLVKGISIIIKLSRKEVGWDWGLRVGIMRIIRKREEEICVVRERATSADKTRFIHIVTEQFYFIFTGNPTYYFCTKINTSFNHNELPLNMINNIRP